MSYQPYGYPPAPLPLAQVAVLPYRASTAHVVIAWVAAVLTGFYLLPWAIAATRNRRNVAAVALVDLFLGWTVIGWFAALIMACGNDPERVLVQHVWTPAPAWNGPAPWGQPPPPVQQQAPVWQQAPASVWEQPAPRVYDQAPPAPRALPSAPEETRVDLSLTEPTQVLGGSPWSRPAPYDPPAYGPEPGDRR